MSESTLSALDLSASDAHLGKSFLLIGVDTYLADTALDIIRLKLKIHDKVDTFIVYGDEVKSSELNEHLDTFSIFSSAKLVIIRNAEKLDKKELDTLSEYFDAPSEIQSLAIVAEKIDARLSSWKKIKAGSITIVCDPPRFGGAIRSWLDKALKKMNKTMTAKAMEEFLNRVELDYYNAANELVKLDLLTQHASTITDKDVLKSLGTSRSGTLIDFYRALGRKQSKGALESMEKMLFADWEPLQVLSQVYRFYLSLWKILLLKKAHISDSEINSKHMGDIFQTQRKEYMEFSRNYKLESIEAIFGILLETDANFKLSVAEPNILLSTCLIKILDA